MAEISDPTLGVIVYGPGALIAVTAGATVNDGLPVIPLLAKSWFSTNVEKVAVKVGSGAQKTLALSSAFTFRDFLPTEIDPAT